MIIYGTPDELIAYLETPGRKKWTGSFGPHADGRLFKTEEEVIDQGERCCLGHYGVMCGMDTDPSQGLFIAESARREFHEQDATLPDDHWLLDKITYDVDYETEEIIDLLLGPDDVGQTLQSVLAEANDAGEVDDFTLPLILLKHYAANDYQRNHPNG